MVVVDEKVWGSREAGGGSNRQLSFDGCCCDFVRASWASDLHSTTPPSSAPHPSPHNIYASISSKRRSPQTIDREITSLSPTIPSVIPSVTSPGSKTNPGCLTSNNLYPAGRILTPPAKPRQSPQVPPTIIGTSTVAPTLDTHTHQHFPPTAQQIF